MGKISNEIYSSFHSIKHKKKGEILNEKQHQHISQEEFI